MLAGLAGGSNSGKGDSDPGAFLGSKSTPLYSPLTGILAQLNEIQIRRPALKTCVLSDGLESPLASISPEKGAQEAAAPSSSGGPIAILNRLRGRILNIASNNAHSKPGHIVRSIQRHVESASAGREGRRKNLGPIELTAEKIATLRGQSDIADVHVKCKAHPRVTVVADLTAHDDHVSMAVARTDLDLAPSQRYKLSLEAGSNLSNSSRLSVEAHKGTVEADGQSTASHASADVMANDFAFGLSHSRRLTDDAVIETRYFAEARSHTSELLVRTSHDLGRGRTLAPSCTVGFYYGRIYDSNFEVAFTSPTSTQQLLQALRQVQHAGGHLRRLGSALAQRTGRKGASQGAEGKKPAGVASAAPVTSSTGTPAATTVQTTSGAAAGPSSQGGTVAAASSSKETSAASSSSPSGSSASAPSSTAPSDKATTSSATAAAASASSAATSNSSSSSSSSKGPASSARDAARGGSGVDASTSATRWHGHSPFPTIFSHGPRSGADIMPGDFSTSHAAGSYDDHTQYPGSQGSVEIRALVSARGAVSLQFGLRLGSHGNDGQKWRRSEIAQFLLSPILLM